MTCCYYLIFQWTQFFGLSKLHKLTFGHTSKSMLAIYMDGLQGIGQSWFIIPWYICQPVMAFNNIIVCPCSIESKFQHPFAKAWLSQGKLVSNQKLQNLLNGNIYKYHSPLFYKSPGSFFFIIFIIFINIII